MIFRQIVKHAKLNHWSFMNANCLRSQTNRCRQSQQAIKDKLKPSRRSRVEIIKMFFGKNSRLEFYSHIVYHCFCQINNFIIKMLLHWIFKCLEYFLQFSWIEIVRNLKFRSHSREAVRFFFIQTQNYHKIFIELSCRIVETTRIRESSELFSVKSRWSKLAPLIICFSFLDNSSEVFHRRRSTPTQRHPRARRVQCHWLSAI